jgi:hypothetical protein
MSTTIHVLFHWTRILCQPAENTNPQTWNQTSNWFQAPKTTCIFWRKDAQKNIKTFLILDKLCVTAPNSIGTFIQKFLNILTDSLSGLTRLLTDLTEAWKVKCVIMYILYRCIHISEEVMVSVSVILYYYDELCLDFTYYDEMYSELEGVFFSVSVHWCSIYTFISLYIMNRIH